MSNPALGRTPRPAAFVAHWPGRLAWIGLGLYVLYAAGQVHVSWERIVSGLPQAAKLFGRMFPPNMAPDKIDLITSGMLETIQIAVIATVVGVLLSLPLSLMAARNLSPGWLAASARVFIAVCRSFHPVIVSILFVKAVGFGALAGILTLTVASVGFIGKLFAEAIEEISLKQVEAVRATGAPFASVLAYGVLPQVMSRFVGFATYQVDSNLRNSTMVGIVGAGGIGSTLFAAFQRFDYSFVCAILIAIIAMIMVGETLARVVRSILGIDARRSDA